jgi:hypothetical protein
MALEYPTNIFIFIVITLDEDIDQAVDRVGLQASGSQRTLHSHLGMLGNLDKMFRDSLNKLYERLSLIEFYSLGNRGNRRSIYILHVMNRHFSSGYGDGEAHIVTTKVVRKDNGPGTIYCCPESNTKRCRALR